jgi:hypothetical protein
MCSACNSTACGPRCSRIDADVFARDRIRRRSPGRYQVKLRPNERVLVADLVDQLREQLLASTDDEAVRRLFPPAYPQDAERDAGYQVMTRDDLLEIRLAAIEAVERTIDGPDLDEDDMTAWMSTLNALRLVIGTRLDVDEDPPEIDPDDPMAPAHAVYEFLGWLLSQAIDVLSADLRPPDGPGPTPPTPPAPSTPPGG